MSPSCEPTSHCSLSSCSPSGQELSQGVLWDAEWRRGGARGRAPPSSSTPYGDHQGSSSCRRQGNHGDVSGCCHFHWSFFNVLPFGSCKRTILFLFLLYLKFCFLLAFCCNVHSSVPPTCRPTRSSLFFLSKSSCLLASLQSSSEVASAAELVSAIEKLVQTKMVSRCCVLIKSLTLLFTYITGIHLHV